MNIRKTMTATAVGLTLTGASLTLAGMASANDPSHGVTCDAVFVGGLHYRAGAVATAQLDDRLDIVTSDASGGAFRATLLNLDKTKPHPYHLTLVPADKTEASVDITGTLGACEGGPGTVPDVTIPPGTDAPTTSPATVPATTPATDPVTIPATSPATEPATTSTTTEPVTEPATDAPASSTAPAPVQGVAGPPSTQSQVIYPAPVVTKLPATGGRENRELGLVLLLLGAGLGCLSLARRRTVKW